MFDLWDQCNKSGIKGFMNNTSVKGLKDNYSYVITHNMLERLIKNGRRTVGPWSNKWCHLFECKLELHCLKVPG